MFHACGHIFKVDNPSFMGIQPPKGEPLLAAVVVFGGWLNPKSGRILWVPVRYVTGAPACIWSWFNPLFKAMKAMKASKAMKAMKAMKARFKKDWLLVDTEKQQKWGIGYRTNDQTGM